MNRLIRIQEPDFSVANEYQALLGRLDGATGAIATFVGLVRDISDDGSVSDLTLEHYPGMTEASLNGILDKAQERFPVSDLTVIHRVGRMTGREQIVLVMAASRHRDAAFEACSFVMDYLKTDAVFWKKEQGDDGDRWIQSTDQDRARAQGWHKPRD
jgi:molybdopterin synthase catalytic subunit